MVMVLRFTMEELKLKPQSACFADRIMGRSANIYFRELLVLIQV